MPANADTVTLVTGSGGGDDLAVDHDFYLSPLPPPGDLVVFCAWPAFDVPETRTVLDADLVVEAAQRAVVLWPEPGPEEHEPVAPPRPRPPAGGWFAATIRTDNDGDEGDEGDGGARI